MVSHPSSPSMLPRSHPHAHIPSRTRAHTLQVFLSATVNSPLTTSIVGPLPPSLLSLSPLSLSLAPSLSLSPFLSLSPLSLSPSLSLSSLSPLSLHSLSLLSLSPLSLSTLSLLSPSLLSLSHPLFAVQGRCSLRVCHPVGSGCADAADVRPCTRAGPDGRACGPGARRVSCVCTCTACIVCMHP
jgi:hypothetical protein